MYQQPSFYHFSQVSIELAKFASNYKFRRNDLRVLDLCAGCGVVGIEFSRLFESNILSVDFLEKQMDFEPFLKKNLELMNTDIEVNSYFFPFWDFKNERVYDAILCNPPYFDPSKSRPPISLTKSNCQQMHEFNFRELMNFIRKSLSIDGIVFLSQREEVLKELKLSQWQVIEKKVISKRTGECLLSIKAI